MSHRAQMRMATSVIVLVLGLQFVAVIASLDRWGWPFTDYPMYSQGRQDGDRITARHYIYAKTDNGQEVEITSADIGVNIWLYEKWRRKLMAEQADSVPVIIEQTHAVPASTLGATGSFRAWLKSTRLWQLLKDKNPDLHSILLEIAERNLGIDIVQLRIDDTGFVVTRDGAKAAAPEVVLVDVRSQ